MSKQAYVKAYLQELRDKVVQLMQVGERSPRQVAEEFGISEDSVRRWVQQAEREHRQRPDGPELRDVRDFAAPDPRPKADSPALTGEREGYIGAFDRTENWLEEWTVFGPESVYDLRERGAEEN